MKSSLNPWGLTSAEMVTMQLLTGEACGQSKQVARVLKMQSVSVDRRILRIRHKMKARSRLEAILLFDREYRTRMTALKPAHGVQDCEHCRGLGFVARLVA